MVMVSPREEAAPLQDKVEATRSRSSPRTSLMLLEPLIILFFRLVELAAETVRPSSYVRDLRGCFLQMLHQRVLSASLTANRSGDGAFQDFSVFLLLQ